MDNNAYSYEQMQRNHVLNMAGSTLGGDLIGPGPIGYRGYTPGPEGDAQRAKDIAEKEAYQARDLAYGKLDTAIAVIRQFGTTVDVEQAGKAIAKIAATAMRRRA